MDAYIGVDGVARKAKAIYVGVNGVARKVKKVYVGVNGVAQQCYNSSTTLKASDYLNFSATTPFTVSSVNGKTWDSILEYSTDAETWSAWDGSVVTAKAPIGTTGIRKYWLYFRGWQNTKICNGSVNGWNITIDNSALKGAYVSLAGNIETLLDYEMVERGNHPSMADYCFHSLFSGGTRLTSISSLLLPAETLSTRCYAYMFSGCTGIKALPKLPAITLATGCYIGMFQNCAGFGVYETIQLGTEVSATTKYRIPTSGTGVEASGALAGMFSGTGGTVTTPSINTTYYVGDPSSSGGGDVSM